MKTHQLFSFIIICFSLLVITSCNKKPENENPNFSLTELLSSGPWEISSFTDGAVDHTSNFNGFTFTFLTSGIMYASNSTETAQGSWANENSATKLNMTITGNEPLPYLNKGWEIITAEPFSLIIQCDNSGQLNTIHLLKK